MPAATRSIDVNVPPARLMEIITDFAAYPQFLPEMEEATVLRRDGDVWVARFAVKIVRRIEYTLRLVKESETALSWTLVEGAFRANNGGWKLAPLDGGSKTRADYSIDLDVGMFVPGTVMKTLVGQSLPATLEAFKRRAESR